MQTNVEIFLEKSNPSSRGEADEKRPCARMNLGPYLLDVALAAACDFIRLRIYFVFCYYDFVFG